VDIDEILIKLDAVRRQGDGWIALCPAHNDHHPSLSIRERNGKLLLHCFAGCSFEDVLSALGAKRKR